RRLPVLRRRARPHRSALPTLCTGPATTPWSAGFRSSTLGPPGLATPGTMRWSQDTGANWARAAAMLLPPNHPRRICLDERRWRSCMAKTCFRIALLCVALAALLPANAFARSNDRVQFGRDIYIEPGDKAGDLVCLACSIHVHGQTTGDVVAVAGSIVLEGAQVAGDAVAVGGSLRLQGASRVGGDAVSIIGSVHRDSEASVGGDLVSLGGPIWFLLIVIMPFALFAAFITLIVWLIQKVRQPPQPYPGTVPNPRV